MHSQKSLVTLVKHHGHYNLGEKRFYSTKMPVEIHVRMSREDK